MQTKRLQVNYQKKPCYEIVFESSFQNLKEELKPFSITEKKICIITDSNVEKLYGDEVKEILQKECKKVVLYAFPAGEGSKNLKTVQNIYKFLIKEGFERRDMLLSLGGGVAGDLTGFIAATYLRGIDYIQIPTTLLAQADSSVGGKTGVDFEGYKNMVGAFYMPKLVYMNPACLSTLDERQYYAGFAEVMKYGLIKDVNFYTWLIEMMYEIHDKDMDTLSEMIYRSCEIKKKVVENDPTEQGERALLNFGHTIGHAIEKYKKFELLHGECVALGAVCAAYISFQKGLLLKEEYLEIRDMFVPFNLPITITDTDEKKVLRLTKSDKKMENGHVKFILLNRIGKAVIDETVTDSDIKKAVKEICFNEDDSNE